MEELKVRRRGFCLLMALMIANGCAMGRRISAVDPKTAETTSEETGSQNPILVRANNDNECWERTVDLVHDYFEIARENRLDGIIETRPKVGASLLEPWHRDSAGLRNRLESSLQSIRRRAFVSVTSTADGYLLGVEVFKEKEDVVKSSGNTAGNATFQENRPLQRDLRTIVGESAPEGWIALGRDAALEQRILEDLASEFSD